MSNAIVEENLKEGTPREIWDAPATDQIEGFATDISVNHGERVDFKINVNAAIGEDVPYHFEVYRLGYYGGDGARLVYSSESTGQLTGQAQPDPLYNATTGMVDAGNWEVSAGWDVPEDAVSGVYLVKLVRDDNGATNQIPFIVRDDDGPKSDILLQTSDTTWQAYNSWGGNNGVAGASLYGDQSGTLDQPEIPTEAHNAVQDRAYAVSYNRPFITRDNGDYPAAHNYLFGADYAAIYWLEENGYDVSYISGVDTDRLGADYLIGHKAFISVGHDEYWSGQQRLNVEEARDAGVNLLFWSGNEVYWKTRWETSISEDGTEYRTLVCYKETFANADPNAGPEDYANLDPSNEWTGTWRDMRFIDAVDSEGNYIAGGSHFDHNISGTQGLCSCITGAGPETTLTGQLFGPDGTGQFGAAIDIPAVLASLRYWRDTTVADGGAVDLSEGIIGYEWNTVPDDEYRPAGLIKLTETVDIPWGSIVTDQGGQTFQANPGVATHSVTVYRAESGALVFSAGTVFWSWGLSDEHDNSPYSAQIANPALQQLAINVFADMGIQPGVDDMVLALQGLVRASGSTDHVAATAAIDALPATADALQLILISGTATDNDGNPLTDDGQVALVEISFDNGLTWKAAQGTTNWSYIWRPTELGPHTIQVRAVDDSLNITDITPAQATITVTAPTQFSLFDPLAAVVGEVTDDGSVELGMRFSADRDGQITELKYFRAAADANDTDIREGHLWGPDGTLLATVTFVSAPGQHGWQVATLSAPVNITAGLEYVVSYHTEDNFAVTRGYFAPDNEVAFDGVDDNAFSDPFGVISSPQSSVVGGLGSGGNGVFSYDGQMPNATFDASNYWTDITFRPADGSSNHAPSFTSNASFTINENQTAVGSVVATDADGDAIVYSIIGGADAAKFTIDSVTGALQFGTAPNFEHPLDAGGNNVYDLIVRASDGRTTVSQNIAVTVADVQESQNPPASVFDSSAPVTAMFVNDGQTVELGMKFVTGHDGQITELKYYRGASDANDTDVRTGHLWGPDGTLLATVTFTSTAGQSGWQVATLNAPVVVTAGLEYVVSYRTNDNFAMTLDYFNPSKEVAYDGLDNDAFSDPAGIIGAPQGSAGVYVYGTDLVMPSVSFQASNYWTDVTFMPEDESGDPNQAPSFTSNASFAIDENQTVVGNVVATDPDGDAIVYSIIGGADAAKFTIDSVTGTLKFGTAPDFEQPADAGGDNVYDIVVRASDGRSNVSQNVAIAVGDVEDAPRASVFNPSVPVDAMIVSDGQTVELGMKFVTGHDGEITELKYYRGASDANDTDVRTGHLWGPDGTLLATVTFTSTAGQSGWQVATLDSPVEIVAGLQYVVSYRTNDNFAMTLDYFNPSKEIAYDGLDNDAFSDPAGIIGAPQGSAGVYAYGTGLVMPSVSYQASNYWVDVTYQITDETGDPNEAPSFTSNASFAINENQTAVGNVVATDPDGDAIVYSIAGGADAARFTIDSATGALRFGTAPDFEHPLDANGDNVYDLIVRASDGRSDVSQNVAVTVADVEDAQTASIFDPAAPVTAMFINDGQTVELGMKFVTGQDGEITELKYYRGASDSNDTDVRTGHLWGPGGTLLATVTFTSTAGQSGWQVATLDSPIEIVAGLEYVVSYRTNDNFAMTLDYFNPENEVAYDGYDNDAFSDPSGIIGAPQGSAGVYVYGTGLVMPHVSFQGSNYWTDISFRPTEESGAPNEPPSITSDAYFTIDENQTAVGNVVAADEDGDEIVYSIIGGTDATRFTIDSVTGALSFITAPNFEQPLDADGDNVYDLIVRASDGRSNVSQNIAVAVSNVDEGQNPPASVFDPSAPVTAMFINDGQTVELGMKFVTGEDGEITELKYYRGASDANDTDVRTGHLWGPDGTLLATVTFTSTAGQSGWQVATLDSPVEIIAGLQYVVSYRTDDNFAMTLDYFDPSKEVAYDGLDNDAFSDPSGIIGAPQGPAGVYVYGTDLVMPSVSYRASNYWADVTFQAAGESGEPNEAPSFTSDASFTIDERQTTVGNVVATDPDGDAIVYSIIGGADAGKFTIDSITGALSFGMAPDFEQPADAGGDNVYDLVVRAFDGRSSVSQNVAVSVADVDDAATASVFNPAAPVTAMIVSDGQTVELGMKFVTGQDGQITELKYYRGASDANDTDVRTGHLWGPDGSLLGTVTFTSTAGQSGWQVATLDTAVDVTAGVQYIVSYRTNDNFAMTLDYFEPGKEVAYDGIDNDAFSDPTGVVGAPQGASGVYVYGTDLVMPSVSYRASNYWADVTFQAADQGGANRAASPDSSDEFIFDAPADGAPDYAM